MPNPLLERAIEICKQKKLRFTPIRQRVFLLMAKQKGAVSAYELLELLKKYDANAKPPTIYRALDFLLENHFIHRIESLNAYLMCNHFGREHPMQLLICDKCHKIIGLADQVIDEAFSEQAKKSGFKITNKVLEAHGICHSCLTFNASTACYRSNLRQKKPLCSITRKEEKINKGQTMKK